MEKLQKYKDKILLVCILFFAAFLRLYRIADYMTFLGDEGRDVLVVYGILHGKLTLLGPTSSVGGFFLGPLYYYFMAPFLWFFNYNPVGPAVMVAFFGIATVWLVYKIGSEFFNKPTGIIAASLYTISPVVVAYSRSSWNPNLMPFFTLLTLYFIYMGVKKNSPKLFFTSGLLFGVLMQLHYLALFVGFIIIAYVILMRLILLVSPFAVKSKRVVYDGFFIFLGFLVGWAPFFAFEIRHGFLNIKSIIKFVFSSGGTGSNTHFFSVIGDVFFRIFGRLVTAFPPAEQISTQNPVVTFDFILGRISIPVFLLYLFTFSLGFFSVGLFLWNFIMCVKKKKSDIHIQILIFLWFFIGIVLFGFYKKSIYDYYFGFLFPIPFFFVAQVLYFLWRKKKIYRFVSVGIFIVLLFLNLQGIPFRSSANRQLAQMQTIANFVLSKTNGRPYNFAIISSGNSDHAYRYFFKLTGRDPVEIKKPYEDPKRASVTDQLFVICEGSCGPLGNPAWEISGFGRAEIVDKWHVIVVDIYKLTHYTGVDK